MDDQAFHNHQVAQFRRLATQLKSASETPGSENLALLAEQFEELASQPTALLDQGAALLHRLMTAAPGLAALVPRDLLWYLGGECLHFMPDDEIERFSDLDEQRRQAATAGDALDWQAAIQKMPPPQ